MSTTTIRISTSTHTLLRELARQTGGSMQSVLEAALEQYRRHQALMATNAAYAALRDDREGWADLERERTEWDQTIADGLEA